MRSYFVVSTLGYDVVWWTQCYSFPWCDNSRVERYLACQPAKYITISGPDSTCANFSLKCKSSTKYTLPSGWSRLIAYQISLAWNDILQYNMPSIWYDKSPNRIPLSYTIYSHSNTGSGDSITSLKFPSQGLITVTRDHTRSERELYIESWQHGLLIVQSTTIMQNQ